MKKFLPLGLIVLLLSTLITVTIAATPEETTDPTGDTDLSILYTPVADMTDEEVDEALHLAYGMFMQSAADQHIPITVTFETYAEGYFWVPDSPDAVHHETIYSYLLSTYDELSQITLRDWDLVE